MKPPDVNPLEAASGTTQGYNPQSTDYQVKQKRKRGVGNNKYKAALSSSLLDCTALFSNIAQNADVAEYVKNSVPRKGRLMSLSKDAPGLTVRCFTEKPKDMDPSMTSE
ncbi:hypothetical protein F2P81_016718 [Scophthalmus maximus]|uniref:Uncharacterized protein n=1 Tax=Scophthalmus maximus TaxID=52904 RepID=A0A6A4S9Y9_SCOMX|nr:hypothetical protein F2P81_016718 [Scophthalmus maximus]